MISRTTAKAAELGTKVPVYGDDANLITSTRSSIFTLAGAKLRYELAAFAEKVQSVKDFKSISVPKQLTECLPPTMRIIITHNGQNFEMGLIEKETATKMVSNFTPIEDIEELEALTKALTLSKPQEISLAKAICRTYRITWHDFLDISDIKYLAHLRERIKQAKLSGSFVRLAYASVYEEELSRIQKHLQRFTLDSQAYRPRYRWVYEQLHRKGRIKVSLSLDNPTKGWMEFTREEIGFLDKDGISFPPGLHTMMRTAAANMNDEEVFPVIPGDFTNETFQKVKFLLFGPTAQKIYSVLLFRIPFLNKDPIWGPVRILSKKNSAKRKMPIEALARQVFRFLLRIYYPTWVVPNPPDLRGIPRIRAAEPSKGACTQSPVPVRFKSAPPILTTPRVGQEIVETLRSEFQDPLLLKCVYNWIRRFHSPQMQNLALTRILSLYVKEDYREDHSFPIESPLNDGHHRLHTVDCS